MSKTFKYVFKKNNPATEFYTESEFFLEYVKEKYIDTGKCIEFRKKIIIDEIFQEVTSTWDSQESILEFKEDPICDSIRKEVIQYNEENSIETIVSGSIV